MKKVISILLVAVLSVIVFALPAVAAPTNAEVEIKYTETAPKIDGTVKPGEYGLKVHSVDYDNDEFIDDYDTDHDIEADFYMTWDEDYLYMAWVVHTDIHFTLDLTKDYTGDGVADEGDLGYMWEYCCVQFIITPGEPKLGETEYQPATGMYGDFLEVGLTIVDGQSVKTYWSLPDDAPGLTPDDWDFAGNRDDSAKTTTYEIRLPWKKTGITKIGNDKRFGLTYAIGDQEHFTNVGNNMVEWQDAILGEKNADATGVIILTGSDIEDKDISIDDKEVELDPLDESKIPEGTTTFLIDAFNKAIKTGSSSIITDIDNVEMYNLKYSYNMVARPAEDGDNKFTIVYAEAGPETEHPDFSDVIKEGDIILAFHTDGNTGTERVDLVKQLEVDDEIFLLGIDVANEKFTNTGALMYVEKELEIDDESSDPEPESEPESEPDDSEDESEPVSEEESDEKPSEDGFPTWAIIAIIAGVIVIGGVIYFIIARKKD